MGRGALQLYLYVLLTSYRETRQLPSPAALPLTFTDCMTVWIGPTTGVGISSKEKSLAPSGNRFPIHWTSSSNPSYHKDGGIPILYGLVKCENIQRVRKGQVNVSKAMINKKYI